MGLFWFHVVLFILVYMRRRRWLIGCLGSKKEIQVKLIFYF